MGIRIVVACALLAGVAFLGTPAQAAGPSEFSMSFSPATPGTVTTMTLHFVYRSAQYPNGKPPQLKALRIETPAGTTIATNALPVCAASDVELRLFSRSVCPANTKVGFGTLVAVTGFGAPIDPVFTHVVVFNGGHELIETVSFRHSNMVLGIDRAGVAGNVITPHPPATPGGPPDLRTTVRQLDLMFPAGGGLVRTPPTCPADRQWRYSATIDFVDGPTQVVGGAISC